VEHPIIRKEERSASAAEGKPIITPEALRADALRVSRELARREENRAVILTSERLGSCAVGCIACAPPARGDGRRVQAWQLSARSASKVGASRRGVFCCSALRPASALLLSCLQQSLGSSTRLSSSGLMPDWPLQGAGDRPAARSLPLFSCPVVLFSC
jgi:hypothetical protein